MSFFDYGHYDLFKPIVKPIPYIKIRNDLPVEVTDKLKKQLNDLNKHPKRILPLIQLMEEANMNVTKKERIYTHEKIPQYTTQIDFTYVYEDVIYKAVFKKSNYTDNWKLEEYAVLSNPLRKFTMTKDLVETRMHTTIKTPYDLRPFDAETILIFATIEYPPLNEMYHELVKYYYDKPLIQEEILDDIHDFLLADVDVDADYVDFVNLLAKIESVMRYPLSFRVKLMDDNNFKKILAQALQSKSIQEKINNQ